MNLSSIKELVIKNSSKEDLIKEIERVEILNFGGKWTLDDIIGIYKEKGMECSIEKARDIADIAEKHHDGEYGINWSYLRETISNYESRFI